MVKRMMSIGLVTILTLSLCACGKHELPHYDIGVADGAREWQLKSVAIEAEAKSPAEPERPLTEDQGGTALDPEPEGLTFEASVQKIAEPDDPDGTMELYLSPDREYEIRTRVLAILEEQETRDSEEDLIVKIAFPVALYRNEQSAVAVTAGLNDGTAKIYDTQTVISLMYDLEMEYVEGSFGLEVNGQESSHYDVSLEYVEDEDDGQMGAYLTCLMPRTEKRMRIEEYMLTYSVKTTISRKSEESQAELRLHQDHPVGLEVVGIVGDEQDYEPTSPDDDVNDRALAALSECLRPDYMMPLSVSAESKTLYIVTKLSLPAWSVEYSKQQGLAIEWHKRLSSSDWSWQVKTRLLDSSEQYTAADDRIDVTIEQDEATEAPWGSVITSPVTFWRVNADGECEALSMNGLLANDFRFDPDSDDGEYAEISAITLYPSNRVIQALRDDSDEEIYVVASVGCYSDEGEGNDVASTKIIYYRTN